MKHLNKVLQKAIGEAGLTQRQVERRLGLSQGYLSRLFGGQIDLKVEHVAQIAKVLEVEPEELFRLAFPPSKAAPSKMALRLREAFGVTSPEPPAEATSGIEKELERIMRRALASIQGP